MNRLSEECQRIVRFYEGDVEGSDPFWSDAKAYVTWNSLFFEGITNEAARIRDGKRLNPAFLEDEARLLYISRLLFGACKAWACKETIRVSRVERYDDYCLCRDLGKTISFTSTSTAGLLPQYADKHGVAIMRFCLEPGTPCLPMARALDHYQKDEEEEILLPPFLRLSFKERTPQGEELEILDLDGAVPRVCAEVRVSGISLLKPVKDLSIPDGAEAGKRVFAALNRHEEPEMSDMTKYLAWKAQLQTKLVGEMKDIFA